MADAEAVHGLEEGGVIAGIAEAGKGDVEGLIGGDVSELSKLKQSARKKSLRSFKSRGRFAKSMPKSPLLRMAEMRRKGIRGKDLRHAGLKGLEASDRNSLRGAKNLGGRGRNVLETIQECNASEVVMKVGDELAMVEVEAEIGGVTEVASSGFLSADDVLDEMPQGISTEEVGLVLDEAALVGVKEGGDLSEASLQDKNEAALSLMGTDLALDLCEAQLLQNMVFLASEKPLMGGPLLPKSGNSSTGGKWSILQYNLPREKLSSMEFPPLNKAQPLAGKNKEASSSTADQRGKEEKGPEEP